MGSCRLSVFLMILAAAFASGDAGFEADLRPSLNLPIGRDADFYTLGGGLQVSAHLPLPFFPKLAIGLGLGYDLTPLQAWDASGQRTLSLLSSRAGLALRWPLSSRLDMLGLAEGGYYYAFLNRESGSGGGNPCLAGGVGIAYQAGRFFDLSALVSYRNFFGLYNDLSLAIGTGLDISAAAKARPAKAKPEKLRPTLKAGAGLEVLEVSFEPVFPVFFKYYDNHPVGTAVLVNNDKAAITDIRLSLLVKQYMDNPKQAAPVDRLEPGEHRTVELYGLFTNKVLEITEGSKVSALLSVSYLLDKQARQKEYVQTLSIHNRNALSWDDDRKACSFVTAKDPVVQKFAKNVSGVIKGPGYSALDANLLFAVAMHEALDLYGMTYVVDPTTPYAEFSKSQAAIDYLQFPKQTLEFQAGDCDDLSILYAALLEAVGIETAFITTPGHIFVAFALAMSPAQARERIYRYRDLIVREERVWLPVEITERNRGFFRAWESGARQWREGEAGKKAGFFPMHLGWQVYEPVGFPGESSIPLPDRQQVLTRYRQEVERFLESEVTPQASRLEQEIARTQGEPKTVNQLGVLYARYGLIAKAEAQFQHILKSREFLPALINLGNLSFLQEDWARALSYYQRAQAAEPRSPNALLGAARALRELGKQGDSSEMFGRLKVLAPELAGRFAYLEQAGEARASAAEGTRGVVVWEE